MALHCFFAAWNFHEYLICKNNLEKGQIVVVHDYAQNYLYVCRGAMNNKGLCPLVVDVVY